MAGYKFTEASSFTALDVTFTEFLHAVRSEPFTYESEHCNIDEPALLGSDRVCPTGCRCELEFPWQGSELDMKTVREPLVYMFHGRCLNIPNHLEMGMVKHELDSLQIWSP